MSITLLTVPGSESGYVRRLNGALRALGGLDIREARFPYPRWPLNCVRFASAILSGPDLCHVHWYLSDSTTITRWFLRRAVPKVWTVHNLVPHTPVYRDDLAATHLYLDRVDAAVWHTERSLQEAKAAFAQRGLPTTWHAEDVVIPLMNYNGYWPDTVSREEARHRVGLDPSAFVVGHFSPNLQYKGTVHFLDAIRKVRSAGLAFVIFGETKDPAIERAIREAAKAVPALRIHLEHVPDDDLQVWFKACDVLVQPYTELTTSAAVYFPLAFRRPLIATPLGNIPDLVRPGETGWLVDDPANIAGCIEEASGDPERTKAMGAAAYDLAERVAGAEAVARKHLALYQRVVDARGHR